MRRKRVFHYSHILAIWTMLLALLFLTVNILSISILLSENRIEALVNPLVQTLAFGGIFVATILWLRRQWGTYTPTEETKEFTEIVDPLVRSRDEFCLVLRPFGKDGEIVLKNMAMSNATMEQIIARAAKKSLGFATYALVDQQKRFAPPGPEYLRVPHDMWQRVAQTMIRRAHSIVLLLPPGEQIRGSFDWEVDQIARHNLTSRVIILLAPFDEKYLLTTKIGEKQRLYKTTLRDACTILAALEQFMGSVKDVDQSAIDHYEKVVPYGTLAVKCGRRDDDRPEGFAHPEIWGRPGGRIGANLLSVLGVRVGSSDYRKYLMRAFSSNKRELSKLDFPARYPWQL